jgi:hypothetical protein
MTAAEAEVGMEILQASMADADEAAIEGIASKAKMDKMRSLYVTTKLMAGFLLTLPGTTEKDIAEQLGTPEALPTATERELVKPYLGTLNKMMGIE